MKIRGVVAEIGKKIIMPRYEKKRRNIAKVVLTLDIPGEQRLFADFINENILKLQNIEKNDIVEIDFYFKGTNSSDKKYNNIFAYNISKIEL